MYQNTPLRLNTARREYWADTPPSRRTLVRWITEGERGVFLKASRTGGPVRTHYRVTFAALDDFYQALEKVIRKSRHCKTVITEQQRANAAAAESRLDAKYSQYYQ